MEETPYRFCRDHLCGIPACKNCKRDDRTQWCVEHSVRCEFMMGIELCSNYVKCQHRELKPIENFWDFPVQMERYYCDEHRCQYSGSNCQNSIVIEPDCDMYCREHYEIYKFKFYEFAS